MSDNNGTVGVAEDNLGSHIDELVDKEQATLKHLLVDEHRAASLGGYDNHDGQQVGRQSGPGGIRQCHDGTVDK